MFHANNKNAILINNHTYKIKKKTCFSAMIYCLGCLSTSNSTKNVGKKHAARVCSLYLCWLLLARTVRYINLETSPHSSLIPSKLVCSVFCLPSSPDADMPVLDLSSKLSHQPVLLFLRDPYVLPAASGNQTCHLLTALY